MSRATKMVKATLKRRNLVYVHIQNHAEISNLHQQSSVDKPNLHQRFKFKFVDTTGIVTPLQLVAAILSCLTRIPTVANDRFVYFISIVANDPFHTVVCCIPIVPARRYHCNIVHSTFYSAHPSHS